MHPLKEYHTKALMPLDREPHREMELAWGDLRQKFAAIHGHAISSQFQALPLVRSAWLAGVRANHIQSGFRNTGLHPWSPNSVLVDQAPGLFRTVPPAASADAFQDVASRVALKLPPTI